MLTLNTKQKEFVDAAKKMYNKPTLNNEELLKVSKSLGMNFKPQWLVRNTELRVGRGEYKLPLDGIPAVDPVSNDKVLSDTNTSTKVEKKPEVVSETQSEAAYTGLSGNGKTFSVVQACAESKREMIRVNITIETDEDDLLGGYRLKDGQTVWQNGPVIEAMERGAILLLDEIDLASNKIMCLQPILEGNGVYVKKINKFVKPAQGFNVVATANTKGQGSEDGKFIGTNILNEAFLERFPVTFEQKYPAVKTEQKILNNTLAATGKKDEKYVEKLSTWADVIRKTYFDGGVDEIISTRRLVHIVQAYSIFGNKMKAIELCTNRFDDDTKASFVDLYTKVDAGATAESIAEEQKAEALKAQQMMSNDSEEEEDEEDLV